MTVTAEAQKEIVAYLLSAETERREVGKVTDRYPALSIDTAYAIQEQLIACKEAQGERRIGLKLGLTSTAKQRMMGVHEAIYGSLTSGMLGLEWEPVDYRRFIHPKAEPEIAFFLGTDLHGTELTADDVLRATRYVAPAIEIIDSRYLQFKFTLADVIADNCSSACFILGSKLVAPDQVDLANVGMVFSKNGVVQATGAGAAVLGHPAQAVAWAVNKLGEQGKGLKKGDIVLSGALSEAFAFAPGDTIHVQFAELGSVSLACR